MPEETSKEKWENEGRAFDSHGMNSAEMDNHIDERRPKVDMGKETTHPYKRR